MGRKSKEVESDGELSVCANALSFGLVQAARAADQNQPALTNQSALH